MTTSEFSFYKTNLFKLIRITTRIANWNAALPTCVEYADMASDVSADMLRDPITYALLCFLRPVSYTHLTLPTILRV